MRRFLLFPLLISFFGFSPAIAQQKAVGKKYPSLFWEITGKGLAKPSYLFGTMHVSSKMVFHLSDSFYYAMRNTDAVALELNPESWQDEMFRMLKAQVNLARFSQGRMNDYLKESSFKIERYEDDIRRALTEEPMVVNNLLYRSYQSSADFEENTYLDLYIYQTGRKLGKRPAGVENYLESERLMMEAYQDMAKDKKKRRDTDAESFYDVQKKMQQAYRNGDLDLMDSLQNITSMSAAFSEKFLYLRNEIQANSIDTILKNHSLFVGVGAAHLPGPRGVIELLRKKGYHLRPIFMQDRDASQKDAIDKLRVPVVFSKETTQDGMIQLQLPGKLYRREDAKGNESWQYADMNNGSYYMLTRVRTHAAMYGHNANTVFNKVDSMLYENIPGKIIRKSVFTKNGYSGFDITNRTRRGDLQRYQIMVTPYEVLVFKMSGNDTYVEGKEAETFFNSIKVLPSMPPATLPLYEPRQGGFKVKFPQTPNEALNKSFSDGSHRWEYEAIDSATGNTYMVWKKSLYNFNFIEEDTFDLAMMEESFRQSEVLDKQLTRKMGFQDGMHFIETKYSLKDGPGFVAAKAFVKGPHYYILAAQSKNKNGNVANFFNSFQFTPYKYPVAEKYIDSVLKMEVVTSVKPNVDTVLRSWMEKVGDDVGVGGEVNYSGWPKNKTGVFKSDSTGQSILVTVQQFPKYYYSKDTARFWREKLNEKEVEGVMVFSKKEWVKYNDSISGYNVVLTDTNSSRCIKMSYILRGSNLYRFATISDTATAENGFINTFFSTAKPLDVAAGSSVFQPKLDTFFTDYYSADSLVAKQARQAIPSIYFGKEGVDRITAAINSLNDASKDYFDVKSKFITELGYIKDTAVAEKLVVILKDVYSKSADTSYFQNPALVALARLHTASAYKALKELLTQDPPVFNNAYGYEQIFNQFSDSLALAKTLFPELLQLASLEDYKPNINVLLRQLIDSGYMKAADYETYISKLYFDAKIELKKQQNKEERSFGKDEEDEVEAVEDEDDEYENAYNNGEKVSAASTLREYAALLVPFYHKNPVIPRFFDRLLQSKDVAVQLAAAMVLLADNKKVPDTLLASIASSDRYRAKLLASLEKLGKPELFPSKYKNQEALAKSLLLNDKSYKGFADIQLVHTKIIDLGGKKGNVLFFKYKVSKDDDWKMGLSGMQPVNTKQVNTNDDLVHFTNKKLLPGVAELEQFNEQLKKLLFAQHKSGRHFFKTNAYDGRGEDFDN